jgi:nitrous oxidase accessory protein
MMTSARAATDRPPAGSGADVPEAATRSDGRGRAGGWALGAVAALLVLSASILPIWHSYLSAPQYPDGLQFTAYGNRVEGDLAEIDSLNHYIGMRPFRTDDLPEMALWPVGLGAALAAVAAATLVRKRLARRLSLLYVWSFPLGVLGVIQLRLYQFGHDLDPSAAFRMDGFTPLVIGPTTVWNFTAWSVPGSAIFALLGAAALVTFGPSILRRIGSRAGRAAAAGLAAVAAVAVLAAPSPAAAHDDGDLAAMISSVPDGGTLVLAAGTYHGDIVIDRPIIIEGRGMPLVRGSGTGTVITITATAPGTVLRGIRVTGSGPGPSGGPAGIRIEADDVYIDGVTVEDSYVGISAAGAARVHIVDSHILGRSGGVAGEGHALGGDETATGGRGDGISLWHVDGALVRGNTIENARDAVFVSFGSGALIDGNRIRHNRYGVHSMFAVHLTLAENVMEHNLSAAVLMYGGPALVLRNELVDSRSASTGFGLLLKDVADVEVVENVITRNRAGLHVDGPAGGEHPIRFTANTIVRNQIGAVIYPASGAVFLANSFVDNVVQVLQQGRGTADGVVWHDRGHGNHWGTYRGYDNGRGKGATPHVEGSSVERLLVRAPVLLPLASSPAFRLVRAVEERWALQRPVLVDPLPLMQPISPAIVSHPPSTAAGILLGALGLAATLLAGASLRSMARRPRLAVPS